MEKDEFWVAFHEHVFDPMFYRFTSKDRTQLAQSKSKARPKAHRGSLEDDLASPTEHEAIGRTVVCLDLEPTDDALLLFLLQFAKNGPERDVLNSLRSRRVYHRIAVLSGDDPLEAYKYRESDKEREEEQKKHKNVYDQFRNYRLDGDLERIENLRLGWERNLVRTLRTKLPANVPLPLRRFADELDTIHPLVLVDVPVKSTRRAAGASHGVRYLTEDSSGVHSGQYTTSSPRFETTRVILDDENFDKRAGKIRVFAHPNYRD